MPPKNIKAVENRRRAQQRECKKRKYLEIKNDPELLAIEQEKRRIRYKKRKEEAITQFEADLIAFFNHVHKINFQYIGIKTLKNNLPVQEALLHVDFSENYALKFAEEVQAFHFGGSRQQVSLHTSVAYTHNFTSGVVTPMSYCTIFIKLKKNTWNYSEAGHGKGAPDGVGAVLKRTADRMTLFGKDIGTYDQFCDILMQNINNIIIKKVDEKEIIAKERLIPKTLKPFKGTLSVYQVLWDSSVPMTVLRQLSCFDCNADMKCIHGYDLGNVPNYSHGNIENIDPNYVAPLSKSVNSKQGTQNPNKRIVILSDIKIKQSNSLYIGDYEDQNQNFNTNP
ncbi:hypothetical protein HF086_003063 [Spodoptera exigua]|uniref:Uncharacterized protein n=1 Tax=Spodoptera exigua TaxID=7107 RepID=A0A922MPF3_SPOEX|nr:hypothetical protein HF086_003063 [Spodoptera exigua]